MEQRGWHGHLNKVFYWFASLAYLNILWIVFTLIGLIIFGMGPATSALFSVIRKMLREDDEVPITKTFFHYYRKDFLSANGLFFILLITGFVLASDIYFLKITNAGFAKILIFLLLVLSVIYIIISILIFPVYAHYDLKFLENFKYAFILAMIRPHYLLLIIGCLFVAYYILLRLGVLFVFFSFSLGAAIIMSISYKMFLNIKPR